VRDTAEQARALMHTGDDGPKNSKRASQ